MKLYAKAERTIRTNVMLSAFKKADFTVRRIGEWDKWKELSIGGRLQVKMTVYEIKNDMITAYLLSDTLERVAAPLADSKQEVLDWLKEKGYKPEKQWYMQDYGMSEETWNEWNNAE